MKKLQILFICLLLGLLVMPWFNLPQPNVSGVEKETAMPSFSWRTYWTGNFQKQFESWWNGHFGSRRTMLIVKNDIYEVLNLGQFHSGYSGSILQGRQGNLYVLGYLVSKYGTFPYSHMEKNAEETINILKDLQDRLNYMGKDFIFIIAPSKADAREDALPLLWQFRAKNMTIPQGSISFHDVYNLWKDKLNNKKIIYVDALDLLKQKNVLMDSFPDTGIHWSLLASGLTWEECVRRLTKSSKSTLPSVEIEEVFSSNNDLALERDVADLLNIYPKYDKGRPSWKVVNYKNIKDTHPITTLSVGDSFSRQLYWSILKSGFSTYESMIKCENSMPDKYKWISSLNKANVVILIYTSRELHNKRIKNKATKLLAYTTDILLEDWHPYETRGKGQWSRQHSSIAFFHSRDTDHELSFLLKSRFHSEKLKLSVNGYDLTTLDLKSLNLPRKISATIPKIYLEKGLNHIEFSVEGATSPYCVTKDSKDFRVLGVYCSDFSIWENNMHNSINP